VPNIFSQKGILFLPLLLLRSSSKNNIPIKKKILKLVVDFLCKWYYYKTKKLELLLYASGFIPKQNRPLKARGRARVPFIMINNWCLFNEAGKWPVELTAQKNIKPAAQASKKDTKNLTRFERRV
jgi:hypothetical protein